MVGFWHETQPEEFKPYDPKSFGETLSSLISYGIVFIQWDEGEFVGVIAGSLVPGFYDLNERNALCVLFFPDSEELLTSFEEWAKENKAKNVIYSENETMTVMKDYKKLSTILIKRINNG